MIQNYQDGNSDITILCQIIIIVYPADFVFGFRYLFSFSVRVYSEYNYLKALVVMSVVECDWLVRKMLNDNDNDSQSKSNTAINCHQNRSIAMCTECRGLQWKLPFKWWLLGKHFCFVCFCFCFFFLRKWLFEPFNGIIIWFKTATKSQTYETGKKKKSIDRSSQQFAFE